jgi:23S rRNA (uracil1939-C5)-methyltransferase
MINRFTRNSKHIITINSINSRGEGVGRINDWVIFVPYGVPGDQVEIIIEITKRNYSTGRIIDIIKPSSYRVEPPCEYFGSCGGCSFQHIEYNYQLYLKENLLKENLKKIGNIQNELVREIIPSDNIWNYRNKVQLVIKNQKGNVTPGFFRRDSHDLVHINYCPIQHDLSNKFIEKIMPLLSKWTVYNEHRGSGLLRYIMCKTSFYNKELLCTIVCNEKKIPEKENFLENLKDFTGLAGVVQNFNPSLSNSVIGEENLLLWGRNYIIEEIKDIKFMISSSSFFQVNTGQVEKMYDIISRLISSLNIKQAIDAYCGIGTFSLFLSRKAGYVFGIEENKEAVNIAKKNMELNNITNIQFLAGQVEDLLYNLGYDKKIDLIILDPPRKGCEGDILKTIRKLEIEHIVYISCNPATLARDLVILRDLEYEIKLIQPVDMFPHTPHIESICYLQKKKFR